MTKSQKRLAEEAGYYPVVWITSWIALDTWIYVRLQAVCDVQRVDAWYGCVQGDLIVDAAAAGRR